MLGISAGDPSFRDDDGSASPAVAAALAGFAAGRASEHAALEELAGSRLLVPVVAVRDDQAGEAVLGEKASDMAMPTLIGIDGRRAIPAFTGLDALKRWQADARPVPVRARAVWETACAEDSAVVIDVAGPVPFAVEGARLLALAAGAEPPLPDADPDVREIVASVLAGHLDIASFELEPGGDDHDLGIVLTLAEGAGTSDPASLGGQVIEGVMSRLGGRLRRGVQIWLSEPEQELSGPEQETA
ncbi:MAG TPA: SseB family protein [Streptosporangiaceae bacterium]|nr:SseB family protein [Streptosporangiaceae bacterium]